MLPAKILRSARLLSVLVLGTLMSAKAAVGHELTMLEKLDIPAGTLSVDGGELLLNGAVIHENERIELYDAGKIGVLVGSFHTGRFCPESWLVIDPETGDFRRPNPEHDWAELLIECARLVDIVPEVGLLVFKNHHYDPAASLMSWDGYSFSRTSVPLAIDRAPMPGNGEDVTRWQGRSTLALLADASERKRLKGILPEGESDRLSLYERGDVMELKDGFLIGWAYFFEMRPAGVKIALRIQDGAAFIEQYGDRYHAADTPWPDALNAAWGD